MPFVPAPPDFKSITPRFYPWSAGTPIIRVHKSVYPATDFNPGTAGGIAGRFHFFDDPSGKTVPILYGAESNDAAIAETLFRDVPLTGPGRILLKSRFRELSIATIAANRDLTLVELFGHGLRRLGVRPDQLTATEASEYQFTTLWAKALHDSFDTTDGLIWMSRHFNASKAIMLFGDRVVDADLTVLNAGIPLAAPGVGLTMVHEAANKADITII